MPYLLHLWFSFATLSILAVGLSWVVGQAGILSVAHACLAGIGAYAAALITTRCGAGFFPLGLVAGAATGILLSSLLAVSSHWFKNDKLVFATLVFQSLFTSWLTNAEGVTGGPRGIANIPAPGIGPLGPLSQGWLIGAATLGLVGVYFLSHRLKHSQFGRVLRGIRQDESAMLALGKEVTRRKVEVMAVSAITAAFAGALHAHYFTYIAPLDFSLLNSIFLFAVVIIGGAESTTGTLVAAALWIILPELLRAVGVEAALVGNLRQILFGLLFFVLLLVRPRGLLAPLQRSS